MKKILLIILFAPFLSIAQPKGVNAIVVHGVSLSLADDSLNAKGFQIDKIEGETLVTKPKLYVSEESDTKKEHASIVLTVKGSGADIIISAMYSYDEFKKEILGPHSQSGKLTIVENGYTKGSYMRRAFDYMNDFAKSLGNNISYVKQ